MDVPLICPVPVGQFFSYDYWTGAGYSLLHSAAFKSADGAGVFETARKGPKGGRWFAVRSDEAWVAWVATYHCRSKKRAEGLLRMEVARRLGFAPRMR